MLLWSTEANESLGGGRRGGFLAVPFVSGVGTGIASGAVSLISGKLSKAQGQSREQIFG